MIDFQSIWTYLFGAVVFLLPLIALFICLTNKSLTTKEKIIWSLIIIIVPVFGALVYLITHKKG